MERWVENAERYRNYAKLSFEADQYDIASFLAQQSAELLLRAALMKEVGARPLTHSTRSKKAGAVAGGELPEEVARCAKSLEEHYIQARYPDARLGPYERWEAEECLRCLETLWRWIGGLK